MEPFLKTLAVTLFSKYNRSIQDICLVFPNRRAGLFFRKYLAETAGISLCSPQIFTINELMVELSGLQPADPVDLIFIVYGIYSGRIESPENFDDFYNWGEAMIRDFDDLDKSLVNAEALFSNMLDLKKIDTIFDYLTDEQKETISHFWGSFSSANLSVHQNKFLSVWESLFPIYTALNEELRKNAIAYEGMIYRHVAENILKNKFPETSWTKVVFAGFNALSEAEKALFRYYRDSEKGEFYWDYDSYYIENPVKEAGRFIRNNLKEFPSSEPKKEIVETPQRKINIYELPSDVAQAKFVNDLLANRDVNEIEEFHNTALILCNENLLLPVLYSLPQQIKDVNITMGYPLNHTPVYSLIEQLIHMQEKTARHSGNKENKFYYKFVLSILEHQYIRELADNEASSLKAEIYAGNIIYVEESMFEGKGILEKIFIKTKDVKNLTAYLISILSEIVSAFSSPETAEKTRLEKEYIYHLITSLRKFRNIYQKHNIKLNIDTFSRLFRKIIRSLRIPFVGEPLAGLQIMGILETRLLDFKNLIFLSMNEGIMPAGYSPFSYIPNSLRYGFNMPSREDHDAIYAYYFHRILQRAEKVDLLFNSKSDGIYTGEMSRYLYQLFYDKNFNADFNSVGFNIRERTTIPVTIKKSPEIMTKLKRFIAPGNSFISPSSLNTYLDCRLKFYFSRIAGLSETDELLEEIEARDMGILLHDTMFILYSGLKGKTVRKEDISELSNESVFNSALDKAYRKHFLKTVDETVEVIPEGKNIIIYEMIKKLVQEILKTDKNLAPFEIIALEENLSSEITIQTASGCKKIKIGGKIDRIDKIGDKIRIIDYKTGDASTSFKSVDELFDRSKPSRNKSILQTLIYSWIYSNTYKIPAKITSGLYLTRKIFIDGFDPMIKLSNNEVDFSQINDPFSEKLQGTLEELFNDNIPFDQTILPDPCRNCDYTGICHREEFKTYK